MFEGITSVLARVSSFSTSALVNWNGESELSVVLQTSADFSAVMADEVLKELANELSTSVLWLTVDVSGSHSLRVYHGDTLTVCYFWTFGQAAKLCLSWRDVTKCPTI
jgi:hypothetical protein